MTGDAEQSPRRTPGRINEARLSRIGVTVATAITAASVTVVSAVIVFLAANMVDAETNDPYQGPTAFPPIGPSFGPDLVWAAGVLFSVGMAVLAASGLLGLLARVWRRGPVLPILHVVLALLIAAPVFVGAGLLQTVFIALAFPFPLLALAVAVVWSTTLYPVSDASPEQLPYVRYRMRRRIDIAVATAVGVQFLGPLVLLLVAAFTGR